MECMEEGYLAKILKGDGASGIKVGEVLAWSILIFSLAFLSSFCFLTVIWKECILNEVN